MHVANIRTNVANKVKGEVVRSDGRALSALGREHIGRG